MCMYVLMRRKSYTCRPIDFDPKLMTYFLIVRPIKTSTHFALGLCGATLIDPYLVLKSNLGSLSKSATCQVKQS